MGLFCGSDDGDKLGSEFIKSMCRADNEEKRVLMKRETHE